MTKKPKKQSSNFFPLYAAFYFLALAGFILYVTFHFLDLLYIVAAVLFVGIISIFPFLSRLREKRSDVELKKQDLAEKDNLISEEISSEFGKIEAFRKKVENYSQLKVLTEKLSMCFSLTDTSHTLSKEVNHLFGHGKEDITCILYIFHSKTGELGISSSQKGQMQINLKSKKGDMFDQWIVKIMQPLIILDVKTDYRFDVEQSGLEESRTIRSLISTPLIAGTKALGILRVDSPKENYFISEDLRFLSTIGGLAAIAIENAQLYERVEELAIKDSLTGLYLRKHLLDRFSEEISRHLRSKKELSFLMLDLDHFKAYNDKFGHMAGDIVLRSVALILADFFSEPGNVVCRYGGEEFCVLLPDCSKEKAVEKAEEFRKKIERQTIILRRQKTNVTVSIGIATFPHDAHMKDELIHLADQAMYNAKKTGRNKVSY